LPLRIRPSPRSGPSISTHLGSRPDGAWCAV